MDRFVIRNEQTGEFVGAIKGFPVEEFPDAMKFDTYSAASEASQEYGPEWFVEEV